MSNTVVRSALVTGSAQGIGAAIVEKLQHQGIEVIGVDLLDDHLADRAYRVDLSDWDAVGQLLDDVQYVDILVNNAAVLIERSITEYSEHDFALTHDVNLRAPFLLSRDLGTKMGARGFGRIINVSSVAARTGGLSDSAVYSASKAGLVSMTKYFARTLGPSGVTCNAVLPGAIETPMAQAQWERNPHLRDSIRERIPLGRYGTGADVAEVVGFLASDGAGFVTGVCIDVNGGWIMV